MWLLPSSKRSVRADLCRRLLSKSEHRGAHGLRRICFASNCHSAFQFLSKITTDMSDDCPDGQLFKIRFRKWKCRHRALSHCYLSKSRVDGMRQLKQHLQPDMTRVSKDTLIYTRIQKSESKIHVSAHCLYSKVES